MKRFLILYLACFSFFVEAQVGDPTVTLDATIATDSDGETVILFPDGSWEPMDGPGGMARRQYLSSPQTRQRFSVGHEGIFGVWYSPSFWTPTNPPSSKDYVLEFKHVGGGAYAYILFTNTISSIEELKKIALNNIGATVDNQTVLTDRMMKVNGFDVLSLKVQGMYFGEPVTSLVYTGYYYTGPIGSLQFVVYTTQALDEDYRCQIHSLLNGLVLLPFKREIYTIDKKTLEN